MDVSLATSLIGAYIATCSILAIYHLFAVQSWIQRCEAANSAAATVIATTMSNDLSRLRARMECEAVFRSYPWLQLIVVICSLGYISVLAQSIANDIKGLSAAYTVGPIYTLDAVVLFATIASTWRFSRATRKIILQLKDPEGT